MTIKLELPAGRELRYGKIELRNAVGTDVGSDADQRKVGGYAARFNNPTTIGGYFRETIAPGAFTKAISTGQDVRALFNHDNNFVIGRSSAGTLRLAEDDDGLLWEADPPDTSWASDLMTSIARGDISECSFQFVPVVEEWDFAGDMPLRTLTQVDLYDVSAVTFPAYDDTSVALRSLEKAGAIPPMSDAQRARVTRRSAFLDRLSPRVA